MRILFLLALLVPFFLPRPPATIVVHVGGNLQAAINAASLGDTIVLDPLTEGNYTGDFTLPVKGGCNGSAFVTIESANLTALPEGVRVATINSNLTRLVTINTEGVGVFTGASGGGCYRLRGLAITNNTSNTINSMVDIRNGSYYEIDRTVIYPKEYTTVRTPPYNTTGRTGIVVTGSTHVDITNGAILGLWGLPPGGVAGNTAVDTNAILAEAGPTNDVNADNMYIEPWFNGVFLGGADSPATASGTIQVSAPTPSVTTARLSTVTDPDGDLAIGDVISIELPWSAAYCKRSVDFPCYGNGIVQSIVGTTVTYSALIGTDAGSASRITIPSNVVPAGTAIWRNARITNISLTRSHIHFDTTFCQWQQTNNNNHPKGAMEIKNVDGLLVDGVVVSGWPVVIGIAAVNQSGGDPYATVSNVIIRNSYFKRYYEPFFASMADPYYLNTVGSNISWSNNLYVGMQTTEIPGVDNMIIAGQNGLGLSAQHNTVVQGYPDIYSIKFGVWGTITSSLMSPSTWTIKDNLMGWGNYGFHCDPSGFACITLTETKNLMVLNVNPPNQPVADHFPNSLTSATWAAVKLLNAGACNSATSIDACGLASDSPGWQAASDGTNIGVNISVLKAALSPSDLPPADRGALSGNVGLSGNAVIK